MLRRSTQQPAGKKLLTEAIWKARKKEKARRLEARAEEVIQKPGMGGYGKSRGLVPGQQVLKEVPFMKNDKGEMQDPQQ
eukprot:7919004-Alexandrium_andersonii.AAC.1